MMRSSAFAALAVALSSACSRDGVLAGSGSSGPRADLAPDDPSDFGPLPAFHLLSERGEEVSLETLRGRPLVVAALFTTCSGPCPVIARSLRRLQDELRDTDVLLVAVSVDPERDTPQVLARYALACGADSERWIFLTGEESEVHRLVREGFWLAVQRADPADAVVGDPVTHDTRLLAVDRDGKRRGWYAGTDEEGVDKLRQRMLFLAAEPH